MKTSYCVFGEKGGISTKIYLPEGFDTQNGKCDMTIVMHGFMAGKSRYPVPQIAKALQKAGMAAITFDFDAHGASEGRFEDMTIASEIADARAVFNYVCTLPFVRDIFFVGHSQGGVVAGMLAGMLCEENNDRYPKKLVQLAPAAVLKDDALRGVCMGSKYDPINPPRYVRVFFHKLGYNFIKQAQVLPIYETSWKYTGKVCLIHGTKDKIVPLSYSERYNEGYTDSQLHIINGIGHFMRSMDNAVIKLVRDFLLPVH